MAAPWTGHPTASTNCRARRRNAQHRDPGLKPAGPLWFADRANSRIGPIDGQGKIHTYEIPHPAGAIAVPQGIAVGPGTNVWFTDFTGGTIDRLDVRTGIITRPGAHPGQRTTRSGPWTRRGTVVHRANCGQGRPDGTRRHLCRMGPRTGRISEPDHRRTGRGDLVHRTERRQARTDRPNRSTHRIPGRRRTRRHQHRSRPRSVRDPVHRQGARQGRHHRAGHRPVAAPRRRRTRPDNHHRRRNLGRRPTSDTVYKIRPHCG